LKRFLIRYDPPGIGLEVQHGGECEIIHKDLAAASKIVSQGDLTAEVDRIIAEDDLLTTKRHRPALMQLLGRLYQMDVAQWTAEDGEDHNSPAQVESPRETMMSEKAMLLQEGSSVVLTGLKGDLQVHNGEVGTLIKCRHDKKKYEVHMTYSNTDVKVKYPENLVLCAPRGTQLSLGMGVVIRGLRNHTELNGCLGRIVEVHAETHRFEVRAIESGQLFRVKQENLIPMDINSAPVSTSPKAAAASSGAGDEDDGTFPIGSTVELVGLKTAMAFNGKTADVLSVDRARRRYEIRLADGSVKTIRAENVRLASKVAQPSKASPRTGTSRGRGTKAADRM